MKVGVVGLGSMGKRRVRCLQSLGQKSITGFDPRADRREEAARRYSINTQPTDALRAGDFDALVISTPPDRHLEYILRAIEAKVPAFVEASVISDGLDDARRKAEAAGVAIAPSCTLRFHPAIKLIKQTVRSGRYGAFTNFSYHSGQYLPDWHPWEKVTDFYVSNPVTGGGREIVPFEMAWIVDVVGFPVTVRGCFGKTMDVGARIDDTYVLAMRFAQGFGSLIVDVASRYAVRNLVLNMERGQIQWRWDDGGPKLYDASTNQWETLPMPEGKSAEGYNKNIIEEMYIEELGTFLSAARGEGRFPSDLSEDIKVLGVLEEAERSDGGR